MDLDDKIISYYEKNENFNIYQFYDSFKNEFEYLNIKYPSIETKTTQNIADIKSIINYYLEKDLAYETESGIYLDLCKISNYGNLSNLDVSKNLKNIEINDKKNESDPSLWRFIESKYSYEYLGKQGRPGWDIQCANCCISKMHSSIDYQFAGFNDVTHYENEKVLIENYYNYNGYQSKWILSKYLNFVDDTPYFYMKDYINKYSRQVIKYSIYSMSYSSTFDITKKHFENSIKDIDKINCFYNKLKNIDNVSSIKNQEIDNLITKFDKIDILFENLKIPAILGSLFKLIRCVNKNHFDISDEQVVHILEIIKYINDRLDFII